MYICIRCIAHSKYLLRKSWSGFIESKVRNLAKKLEHKHKTLFFPYPTSIEYAMKIIISLKVQ